MCWSLRPLKSALQFFNTPAAQGLSDREEFAIINKLFEIMTDKERPNKMAERLRDILKYEEKPLSLEAFSRAYCKTFYRLQKIAQEAQKLFDGDLASIKKQQKIPGNGGVEPRTATAAFPNVPGKILSRPQKIHHPTRCVRDVVAITGVNVGWQPILIIMKSW